MTTPSPYGRRHARERQDALARLVDGTPCHLCGRPMYRWQKLQLDHIVPLALGGKPDGPKRLAHRKCNERAGQRISATRRKFGLPRKNRKPRHKQLPKW